MYDNLSFCDKYDDYQTFDKFAHKDYIRTQGTAAKTSRSKSVRGKEMIIQEDQSLPKENSQLEAYNRLQELKLQELDQEEVLS